jgi:hypothetical protein
MNKMFKRVESELKASGNTKVWLANILGESTQNINNWKARGVPASKVKAIAQALGVSREYLEGSTQNRDQGVATTDARYQVAVKPGRLPRYEVFVDIMDSKIDKLLVKELKSKDGLHYLLCTAWLNAEPFIELRIWKGQNSAPWKVMVSQEHIIGITDLSNK